VEHTQIGATWEDGDRLAALRSYGVLDTAPEPAFDSLVQLAAQVCGTPIAAINLIEDRRQWFKAEVGLGIRETPVEVSICAQAILQRGLFVVPDTTLDDRFACNPRKQAFNRACNELGSALSCRSRKDVGSGHRNSGFSTRNRFILTGL
jgi:GAF domain-containing protein